MNDRAEARSSWPATISVTEASQPHRTSAGTREGRTCRPPAASAFRAHEVDRPAVGMGKQEAPQSAPFGLVATGVVPESEEDLLHDLLRLRLVIDEPFGQAEHGAGVTTVCLVERALPVIGDRDDQGGIGSGGEVIPHNQRSWPITPRIAACGVSRCGVRTS